MKRCTVDKSHFNYKNSGIYYTYHLNHAKNYIKFYESTSFKVILPEIYFKITIKKELNPEKIRIGDKGNDECIFALVTDFNNKEKKYSLSHITFEVTFTSKEYYDTINAYCKFWVPEVDNLRIICTYHNDYSTTVSEVKLKTVEIKNDPKYIITIEQDNPIVIDRSYKDISFLYSERQTITCILFINIFENRSLYELKFNTDESIFKNDLFYIYGSNNNYALLDKCQISLDSSNEVICEISKEKIEEILVKNNDQFKIGVMNNDIGAIPFDHILNITINYENIQREDIFLEIKELLGGSTEIDVPVGFITNVTEIPNFISEKFDDIKYFKKIPGRPLILFYSYPHEVEEDIIFNNTEEILINDIHYKYNFRIQPSKCEGRISVKGHKTNVLFTYPQEFDFSDDKHDGLYLIINEPDSVKIKLNPNASSEIYCNNLYKMKRCVVSKSDFIRNKIGLYYTNYLNHKNEYSQFYDSTSIKVILPIEINIDTKYNPNIIYMGNKGIIYLKSDYNDKEKKFFNDSNIEEKTKFISYVIFHKDYPALDSSCHLWKNIENDIFIFCDFNKNLGVGKHVVYISGTNFHYNNLNIVMTFSRFNISIYQFQGTFPFLYSNNQTINIEEGIDTYYLKFNTELYQNENLILIN